MRVLWLRSTSSALIACSLCAAGCQRTAETTTAPPATPQAVADSPAKPGVIPGSTTGESAGSAWQHLVDGVVQGKANDVASALPESYRGDLDHVLARWVGPLDPQVRRETCEAIAGLAQTLAQKEQLVLSSSRVELGGPAAPFVRRHFGPLCRLTAAIANWTGWTTVTAPRTVDLIAETTRLVAAEPGLVEALKSVRFTTVDAPGAKGPQQVAIVSAGSEQPATIEAVQVEGRWLPKELALRWSKRFGAEDRQPSAGEVEQRAAFLREVTARLREIDRSLKDVNTQAEFDALVDRASTLLMATAATEAPHGPRRVENDEFVTVLVHGPLTDEQKDRLIWELAQKTDEPASGIADALDGPGAQTYEIHVGPVHDVQAFAHRMPELVVESVDAKAKKITARLTAP